MHLAVKLNKTAAVRPPLSLPKNVQFLRPIAQGRTVRSERLLSIASAPILAVAHQPVPTRQHVTDRLTDRALGQHVALCAFQPRVELRQQRQGLRLTQLAARCVPVLALGGIAQVPPFTLGEFLRRAFDCIQPRDVPQGRMRRLGCFVLRFVELPPRMRPTEHLLHVARRVDAVVPAKASACR